MCLEMLHFSLILPEHDIRFSICSLRFQERLQFQEGVFCIIFLYLLSLQIFLFCILGELLKFTLRSLIWFCSVSNLPLPPPAWMSILLPQHCFLSRRPCLSSPVSGSHLYLRHFSSFAPSLPGLPTPFLHSSCLLNLSQTLLLVPRVNHFQKHTFPLNIMDISSILPTVKFIDCLYSI